VSQQDQPPVSPAGPALLLTARLTVTRPSYLWRRVVRWFPALAIIAALVGTWEACAVIFDVPRWLLPRPSVIAQELAARPTMFLRHTWVTLEEVLLGFGISVLSGVVLATMIAYSRTLERSIYPLVIASQTIPIIAIAPLLLIWIGYGIGPKVIVVALIAFFPIVVNTVDGLKAVDADMVNMMRTLGASRWQIFAKVQVPNSLPFFFSGVRVAMAVSVIGAVIGEWVGSSQGLGYLMIRSKPQFLTERVFAAIFILSVMGIGLFLIVGLVERYLIPWHYRERQAAAREEW